MVHLGHRSTVIEGKMDAQTLEIVQDKFGDAVFNGEGQPICGQLRDNGQECLLVAGWGTTHAGVGPCRRHGGMEPTELVKQEDSYALYLKHSRLRALFEEEATNENIDNLDNEIVLLRAMLKLMSEEFGVDFLAGESETEKLIQFNATASQIKSISQTIKQLGDLIEQKYRLMHIAGEAIPRESVRGYIGQIQNILAAVLNNQCVKCGHKHDAATKVFTSLRQLGTI